MLPNRERTGGEGRLSAGVERAAADSVSAIEECDRSGRYSYPAIADGRRNRDRLSKLRWVGAGHQSRAGVGGEVDLQHRVQLNAVRSDACLSMFEVEETHTLHLDGHIRRLEERSRRACLCIRDCGKNILDAGRNERADGRLEGKYIVTGGLITVRAIVIELLRRNAAQTAQIGANRQAGAGWSAGGRYFDRQQGIAGRIQGRGRGQSQARRLRRVAAAGIRGRYAVAWNGPNDDEIIDVVV